MSFPKVLIIAILASLAAVLPGRLGLGHEFLIFPNQAFAYHYKTYVSVDISGAGDFIDIQSALDSLPAAGGYIEVKPGIYEITQPIRGRKSNVTIAGAGPLSTIKLAAGYNIAPDDLLMFTGTPDNFLNNITIKDLTIDGNRNNSQSWHLVEFSYVVDSQIFDSILVNGSGSAVGVDNSAVKITDNMIDNNGTYALSIGVAVPKKHSQVKNNVIKNTGEIAVYLEPGSSDVLVERNRLDSNVRYGLLVSSPNNQIVRNIIENNGQHGLFLLEAQGNTVKNNIIRNNGQSSPGYAGVIISGDIGSPIGGSINNVISHNKIYDAQPPPKTQDYGIWLEREENYNVIKHNTIYGHRVGAIHTGEKGVDDIIRGNRTDDN